MDETAPEEEFVAPVAASNVSRATADDDDIVAKYNLENYDEEPGAFRPNLSFREGLLWFGFIVSRFSQF